MLKNNPLAVLMGAFGLVAASMAASPRRSFNSHSARRNPPSIKRKVLPPSEERLARRALNKAIGHRQAKRARMADLRAARDAARA